MKWSDLLFIAIVIAVVIYLFRRKSKRRNDMSTTSNAVDKIDKAEFNNCLVMLLDLYNELTEKIKASINSDNRFDIHEKVLIIKDVEEGDVRAIKERLRSFHLEGKFNDVIDHYLLEDSNMDSIANGILSISKSSSNIPNHILSKLEYKELTIISFLQNEIDAKIREELFLLDSVKKVEQFLFEMISVSRTKLETMALEIMI